MKCLERLPHQPKTVLVVDDEADVREIVAEMITELGYQVKGVPSAEAAQRLISQIPVDLVISDVQMKGRDGLSLARWVRSNFPHLPLAILTAFPTEDLKNMVRHKLVDSYLLKPFLMGDLQGMVQSLTKS